MPPFRIVGEVEILVEPLATLLDQHLPPQTPIDFMSVDVEGFDQQVIASNDWSRFRPRFVLVEMLGVAFEDVTADPLAQILAQAGYRPVSKTCNTVVFGTA